MPVRARARFRNLREAAVSRKLRRQKLILELIEREPVASQRVLQRHLRAAGFEATQATISRDLKQLALVKRAADGAYQRAGEDAPVPEAASSALSRVVGEVLFRVERVQQLVVLGTGPGQAQPLALAIDRAGLTEVVGTIAGDDTILVIARNAHQALALVRRLEALMKG
jgi:transcriptional regulator of arginine metabolism